MSTPVRLIVGLGNPGDRYSNTRHNAGWWLVDHLACAHGISFKRETRLQASVGVVATAEGRYRLAKNLTYMNHSGRSVQALVRFYDLIPEQILVIHDDLDLPVATLRLKQGGGHGGHNGLRDIVATLGSAEFGRLRIGIGHPGPAADVSDYVLSPPGKDEKKHLLEAIDTAVAIVRYVVEGEWQTAMQMLHSPA